MKHRKLRIAWSVTWGAVAVLLVVWWVRSYWRSDHVSGALYLYDFEFVSVAGRLLYTHAEVEMGDGFTWLSDEVVDSEFEREQLPLLAGWSHIDAIDTETLSLGAGFCAGETGAGHAVMVPHWFVLLIIATAGVLPWLRWRYSLRTLLIATTLVAVVLGLIVYAVRS